MRSCLLLLSLLVHTGCATILTGTSQHISIESAPPGSSVIVMGGAPASVLVTMRHVSDVKERIVELIAPALPPETLAVVSKLTADELITQLALLLTVQNLPVEQLASVGNFLEPLPGPVKDKLKEMLGFEGLGVAPYSVELHKGKAHAVVSWQAGRRAKLLAVDTTFNPVVLLNIFTAGLGAIIDVVSGAWLNLTPETVTYTLDPLPGTPPPAP